MALGVSSLARSHRRDPAYVLTLAILNPVTVLHLVGGSHNDALMLGLLVCGIAVARRGRPVAGIVLCALAAAVKVPAAIGILYIGWEWMGAGIPLRARIRPLLTAGLLSAGVMGALSLVTGLGWTWVLNLGAPGTVRSWVAPATGAGIVLTDTAHLVGIGVPLHTMLTVTRAFGLCGALAAGLWLLWRSERIGSLRALGLTLLLVVTLGPVVQPWYLSWGLILLAPVATGKIRSLIIGVSIASAFIGLPGGSKLVSLLLQADPLQVAVALLVCLGIFTVPLTPLQRQRLLVHWRRRRGGGSGPRSGSRAGPGHARPRVSGGLRRRSAEGSEHPLKDGHVDPASEFPSDLTFDADEDESTGAVEGHRGLVVARDAGDDGVEAPTGAEIDEFLEQQAPHTLAAPVAGHVDGVLHCGGVRRRGRESADSDPKPATPASSTATTAGWTPWWRSNQAS